MSQLCKILNYANTFLLLQFKLFLFLAGNQKLFGLRGVTSILKLGGIFQLGFKSFAKIQFGAEQ